ncbi:MAG: MgtC/SapB family protein [Gaiellaceae bacterium]
MLPQLGWVEILARLALAGGLGAAIGIERELRDRFAGLRTHLLVAIGSALFTLVSAYAWTGFRFGGGVSYDPTRIAAQVVTGIGFLGAGAIIRQGVTVHGLTTAATLWAAAAIGMAAAAGFYSAAVLATALTLVVLWPLRILEHRLLYWIRAGVAHIVVELRPSTSVAPVLDYLASEKVALARVQIHEDAGVRTVAADVELERDARIADVVDGLLGLEGVTGAQWIH